MMRIGYHLGSPTDFQLVLRVSLGDDWSKYDGWVITEAEFGSWTPRDFDKSRPPRRGLSGTDLWFRNT